MHLLPKPPPKPKSHRPHCNPPKKPVKHQPPLPKRQGVVLEFVESANTGINGTHRPQHPGEKVRLRIGETDGFDLGDLLKHRR